MGLNKFTALIFFSFVISFSAFAQTDTVCTSNTTDTLYINSVADADSFLWSVPPGAIITSGQYDTLIVVNWAGAVLGLDSVCVTALNECGASGTTCILTFVKAPPTPSNAGPNINVCNVTSVNMAGNTPTQGVGTWTKLSGPAGETITSPNSATTSITGLISGSYRFMWSITNSPCGTSTDTVDVNIDALPTVANAGINDTICSSSYTLNGNNPVVGTGIWTLISGAGTFTDSSVFNTGLTNIGFGSNTFRWTISNGVCAASVDDMIIQRDVPPSNSNAGPNQAICATSTNFQGNNPAEGSGQWTIHSGAGTISNQFLYNSLVTSLGAGVNQFIWTTSQGVCPVSRDTVDITRDIPVVSIDAGPDQNLCNITTATLAGNTPAAGETGTWSTFAGTGTASAVNNPSSGITGLTIGASSTFRWTINTLYGVCADSIENIIINVDPATTIANAGPDQNLCNVALTVLAANNPVGGETGLWTKLSGPGIISTANSAGSALTGLTNGSTTVLVWTITPQFGGCLPTSDTVEINVDPTTTIAAAGADQNLCNITTATLAGNSVGAGESGAWSVTAGSAVVTTPSSPTSGVTGLTIGASSTLVWTISSQFGGCAATTDTVIINVDPTTTIAVAGADQNLCNITTATLAGNAAGVGESGAWSVTSGSAAVTTPSLATSGVTGLTIGASSTLVWTITPQFGGCSVTTDTVIINVDPSTTIAAAGADQNLCNITIATLAGNAAGVGETGAWSVTSGSAIVTTPSLATSGVTGLTIGASSTLVWTITPQFGGCSVSTDTVIINVDPTTTIATAGADQNLCNITTATLAGNAAGVGETGAWSVTSGSAVVTTPSLATSGVTGLTIGASSTLVWTITPQFGGCSVTTDTVIINVDPTTTIAAAGADQNLCNITTATLAGNAAGVGETGAWSVTAGSAVVTTPSLATSGVTGLTIGASSTLVWTITPQFGGCSVTTDTVIINVDPSTTIATAGPDQNLCNITTATLAGNAAGAGETGAWSVTAGSAVVTTPSLATSGVTGLTIGASSTLVWTITPQFGGCSVTTDTIIINVDPTTTIAAAGADQNICNLTTATMAANAAGVGETGAWSVIAGSALVTTPSLATSGITALTIGASSTLVWTISPQFGGCAATTDTVIINVDPATTIANAGADQDLCNSTIAILAGNAVGVGETGSWSVIAGTAVVTTPNSPASAVSALTIGASSTLVWTITPQFGGCSATTDTVIINVDPTTTIANAGPDQYLCNINTATLAANTVGAGETGVWTVISGTGTVTTPNSPTSGVTTLNLGDSSVFVWTISPQYGGCTSTSDTVIIYVDLTTTVANAGPDQDLCNITTATLAGNSVGVGEIGSWSVIAGSAVVTTLSSPVSGVTGLTIGASSTLVWTITPQFSGCSATTDTVIINVDPTTTIAAAGPDQDLCNLTTATLAANVVGVGETGAWSVIAGSAVVTTPSAPASGVTGLTIGSSSILVWTITPAFGGCSVTSDTVIINVDPTTTIAAAGPDQNLCNLTTATLAGNAAGAGETGSWSVTSGTAVVTTPSLATSGVTGLTIGASSTLVWTITPQFGGCSVTTDTVIISVDPTTTIAAAGPDQNICNLTTATLAGNAAGVGETGSWSVSSGSAVVTTPSLATSGVTGLTIGASSTLVWTITPLFGGCSVTTDTVIISVDPTTTIAAAGPDQNLCNITTATLAANAVGAGETGAWSVIAGSAVVTTPSSPTSGVSALTIGASSTLVWTITPQFGGCSVTTDTVIISVDPTTTIAAAGPDQNICNLTTATLAANAAGVGETGSWSVTSGTAVVTTPSLATSGVTGLTIGASSTLVWTITPQFGGCSVTTDTVIIDVDPTTTIAAAGPDQNLCNITTATLAANAAGVGETGSWSVTSGTAVVTTPSLATSGVTGLTIGASSTLVWTITPQFGGCSVTTDTVIIDVDATTTIATAGPDQNLCNITTATLAANAVGAGETGAWSVTSGSAVVTTPSSPTSGVSALTIGASSTLVWTITPQFGGCSVTTDTVIINVDPITTIAAAGPDQNLCNITTATLVANAVGAGETGAWSVTSGSAVVTTPSSPTSGVSALTIGASSTLVWTITPQFGGCPATSDTMIISVDPTTTIAAAGADQALCASSTSMTANASAAFETGIWTLVNGSASITDTLDPLTAINGLIAGDSAIFAWTIYPQFSGCSISSDTVVLRMDSSTTLAAAGPDQFLCNITTATLAANTPKVTETAYWTIITGTVTIADTSDPVSGISGLLIGDTVRLQWNINSGFGGCPTTIDQVTIYVDSATTVANAGSDQNLCNVASTNLAANVPKSTETGIWSNVGGPGTVLTPSNPNSPLVLLTNNSQTTLIWTITALYGGCAVSSDTVIVTVDPVTTIANAGSDQNLCNVIGANLSANAVAATETGTWTSLSGPAVVDSINAENSTISGLTPNSTSVLLWTITSLYGGCPPSTDTIVINVDSAITIASAGPDIYLCNVVNTTLAGNTPAATETGTWSIVNGTGIIVSINDPLSAINGLTVSDSVVLAWTITSQYGGCATTSDTMVVYVDAPVTSAELGSDYQACNVDSIQVFGNVFAANEFVTWNIISGTGTIASPNSQSTWLNGLTIGDTTVVTYTISSLFGGCPADIDTVLIFIDFSTTPSNAGPDQALCNVVSTTLSGNSPASYESGEWVIQSGAATLSATTDSVVTLLNLDPGDSIVITWTISSAYGGCPPSEDTVIVTVDPTLTLANAGADIHLCDTTATTLTANSPLPSETGTWTVLYGTAIIIDINDSNSVATNLTVGDSSILVWTITSQFGGCTSSSDTVVISSDFVTTVSNAGTDQFLCNAINATISGNVPAASETGAWNILSAGTASVASPNSPVSALIGFNPGDTIVIAWTISSEFGGCSVTVDTVEVISYQNSTIANAGLDTSQCKGVTTYNLNANTPVAGVGVWTVVAGSGIFVDPNDPNTTVSGMIPGINSFQWTITNGVCASDSDQVSVTLINCNPQFVDAFLNPIDTLYVTTFEDSAIVVCVGLIDADGDSVDITSGSSLSGNGTVNVNPLGDTCFVFTPNLNYNGMDTLQIFGCDSAGICDSLIVIVTIDSVNNDTPIILDSLGNDLDTLYLTVFEDSSVSYCLSLTDADGDSVFISTAVSPLNGTLVINNDSCFTYTPDTNYNGMDGATIIACDTSGLCDTLIVIITVIPDTGVDPPHIVDSLGNDIDTLYLTVNEDSMITHCLTLFDADGDSVFISTAVSPLNGTLVINNDSCFTYTPDTNYNGMDGATIIACDTSGLCDTLIVIITVIPDTGVDPPHIVDSLGNDIDTLYLTVNEDSMITHCLTLFDADGDSVFISTAVSPLNGTIVINNDSCFTYTPDTNYNGMDGATIIACDTSGLCDTLIVIITVIPDTGVDPPHIVDSLGNDIDTLYLTVNEDSMITHCLTLFDADGDSVFISTAVAPLNGTIVINNDSCFTYTPDTNYNGMDGATIIACDTSGLCDTLIVIITVIPDTGVDPPHIVDSLGNDIDTLYLTVNEDSMITHCLTLFDADGDSVFISTAVSPLNGTIVINNDSCFTYTPDTNYNGMDGATIIACDTSGLCDTLIVIITVIPDTGVDPPHIVDSLGNDIDTLYLTVNEDSMITHCLTLFDADGDSVFISTAVAPLNGTIVINNDSCFTYTPDTNYNGMDGATIIACDTSGLCDTLIVIITVIPDTGVDPPHIVDSLGNDIDTLYLTVNEDSMITHCLTLFDADGDSVFISTAVSPLNGTLVINNDSCFTYTPDTNYNGMDGATIIACDTSGLCDTLIVIITVIPDTGVDPPHIVDSLGNDIDTLYLTVNEDSMITHCLTLFDADSHQVSIATLVSTINGGLVINNDSCFTYTPNPNYFGPDGAIIIACDSTGLCDTVVVIIDVLPVNDDNPIIVNSSGNPIDTIYVTTPEETPLIVCLNVIDTDLDTVDVTGGFNLTGNGSIQISPSGDTCFVYIPALNFVGLDTNIIFVCDQTGACDTLIVIVDVTPINDPPVIVDSSGANLDTLYLTVIEDSSVTYCFNFINVDGDSISISTLSPASNGSVTYNNDSCFTYYPNTNYFGGDTMWINACDDGGLCDSVLVIFDVIPVDDTLQVVDSLGNPTDTLWASTCEEVPIVLCLTVISADGDTVDVTAGFSQTGNGTVNILPVADTCFTYLPNLNFFGIDTLTITVCDQDSICIDIYYIIDVCPLNDPPNPVADIVEVCENDSIIVDVLANDWDVEGDSLFASINSGYPIANGTAYMDANGMLIYTPNAGFSGIDTVEYIVTDNGIPSQAAIAQVIITVNPLPILSATHTNVNCNGGGDGAIDLTVAGPGPYLFSWSNSGTTEDINNLTPGTYTVTVTDSISGCSDTISVTITEPANALNAVITTYPVGCYGDSTGSASVAVTGGTAPYIYQWSTSDTTDSISNLYSATYTVTITDANNCIFIISDSVAQPLAALSGTAMLTNVLCFGDSTGAIDLTVFGGTTPFAYSWSTGDTTQDISGLIAGSYTVTVTDINGCGIVSSYTITEPAAPISMTYVTTAANCLLNIGGNIDITPAGGVGPYTYLWMPGGYTSEDLIGVVAGVYTVTVTDINGCVLIATATLEDSSAVFTTASGNLEFCNGDSVILSTTIYPGASYQWNIDGNPIQNAIQNSYTAFVQGNYTVVMTNSCGTFISGSATVTVNALPSINISEDEEICNGESIMLNATGGISYEWRPKIWLDDPFLPNPIATPLQNTVYVVIVTSADGCISSDTVEVTICDSLFIPNGYSPNGDGKNDAFEIPGAIYYPNNTLKIFNRWGNLVFETDGYKNDWRGESNVNNTLFGNTLPDATYYYIFDPNVPGIEAKMGFVVIKR